MKIGEFAESLRETTLTLARMAAEHPEWTVERNALGNAVVVAESGAYVAWVERGKLEMF